MQQQHAHARCETQAAAAQRKARPQEYVQANKSVSLSAKPRALSLDLHRLLMQRPTIAWCLFTLPPPLAHVRAVNSPNDTVRVAAIGCSDCCLDKRFIQVRTQLLPAKRQVLPRHNPSSSEPKWACDHNDAGHTVEYHTQFDAACSTSCKSFNWCEPVFLFCEVQRLCIPLLVTSFEKSLYDHETISTQAH